MGNVPLPFWDELFIGTSNGMEDSGKISGLAKNGCPGRQAGWIDYNSDNRLDLYVVCGQGEGSYPNKLFQQTHHRRGWVYNECAQRMETLKIGPVV